MVGPVMANRSIRNLSYTNKMHLVNMFVFVN